MKLKLFGLCVLLLSVFLGVNHVSASIEYGALSCEPSVTDANGKITQTCLVGFKVVDKAIDFNKFTVNFTLNNVTLDSFVLENGWNLTSQNGNSYVVETAQTSLPVGTYNIAKITYSRIDNAAECSIAVDLRVDRVDRSCSIYQGNYYGINGNIVSKETYDAECGPKYYCTILPDGTMYGKNGNIVDKATYDKECGKKYVCEVLPDGTKYGSNGTIVDDLTYQKECGKNICTILSDGTIYGKDGQITDRETFEAECVPKNICTIIDGKYYGPNGEELDELEYRKQCEKPICKQIGNLYYDQHGNVTSKENYLAVCKNEIEVPKTGNLLSTMGMIIVGIMGFGIIRFAKKHDRFI